MCNAGISDPLSKRSSSKKLCQRKPEIVPTECVSPTPLAGGVEKFSRKRLNTSLSPPPPFPGVYKPKFCGWKILCTSQFRLKKGQPERDEKEGIHHQESDQQICLFSGNAILAVDCGQSWAGPTNLTLDVRPNDPRMSTKSPKFPLWTVLVSESITLASRQLAQKCLGTPCSLQV